MVFVALFQSPILLHVPSVLWLPGVLGPERHWKPGLRLMGSAWAPRAAMPLTCGLPTKVLLGFSLPVVPPVQVLALARSLHSLWQQPPNPPLHEQSGSCVSTVMKIMKNGISVTPLRLFKSRAEDVLQTPGYYRSMQQLCFIRATEC